MVALLWSISLLWFGHRAPTNASRFVFSEHETISLTVVGERGLPETFVNGIVREAAAVWEPLGITVTLCASEETAVSISVIVNDSESSASTTSSLGWIRFEDGAPQPTISVSRATARRLLDEMASSHALPIQRRDALQARILGRALAHELGHYLLASNRHSRQGLMRANWSTTELAAEERGGFGISVDDLSDLQDGPTPMEQPATPWTAVR